MKKPLALLKLGLLGYIFTLTLVAHAQKKPDYIPPSIDDNEEIPVVKTELPIPEEGKDYVVQYFKGITDGVESRIAVKNLGYIIRPAMVQVISEDGRELAIELVKKSWDDIVRSGTTKKGIYESSFKTALEFGIKINASEMGIPFVVIISAGKELFPASNLFVDAGSMRAGNPGDGAAVSGESGNSSESSGAIYLIIAIALIGIFILLAILVFKKKGKGAATLFFLFLFSLPTHGNVVTAVAGSAVGGMAQGVAQGLANHYGKGGFSGDPLSDDDKDYDPQLDPRGQPSLPSSCYEVARMGRLGGAGGERNKEKEAGCNCLELAYADLQKQRYRLEKLLKIGQHTKKVTDFGISFGDDFAGIHAVSGLAWQKERAKVLKSIDQFDVTYNNKYNEMIEDLYNALIQIDECETKLGYENWYSQSGFIYYEFMKVRYASYK